MKDFQGNIITTGLTAAHLYEMMKLAALEALKEITEGREGDDVKSLSDDLSRAEAAELLNYKSGNSLNQYHFQDLRPIRRNGRIFYKKREVLKLKSKLFK